MQIHFRPFLNPTRSFPLNHKKQYDTERKKLFISISYTNLLQTIFKSDT